MAKTAVALFENQGRANEIVRELEALGFPHDEIRLLGEPLGMAVTGATSTPHTDFELALREEFQRIGATDSETEAYIRGVQRRGVLVFATSSDEKVNSAVDIMNRSGAMDVEKLTGPEPHLPSTAGESEPPSLDHGRVLQAGRNTERGYKVRVFTW